MRHLVTRFLFNKLIYKAFRVFIFAFIIFFTFYHLNHIILTTKSEEITNINVCNSLNNLFKDQDEIRIKWIRLRVQKTCSKMIKTKSYKFYKNNVVIVIGVLIKEEIFKFGKNSFKGGPLGELLQWSDLIVSLFLLGHDITLVVQKNSYLYSFKNSIFKFDLIYTDYIGLNFIYSLNRKLTNDKNFKCKLRILDSFGTEAEYNNGMKSCGYCNYKLNLKQYYTLYPHSPDNTFLGFFIDSNEIFSNDKQNIAIIYAKRSNFLNIYNTQKYLSILKEYFEVHATFDVIDCPKNVICHGVLKQDDYFKLLDKAKLFVGVGFPYEGPAPIEAISRGCVYLNPKFNPHLSSSNTNFFKGKPTNRGLTSQNPYCEHFIGQPFTETISMENENEIRNVLSRVKNQKSFYGKINYEMTASGLFERIKFLIETQDFCKINGGNKIIKPIQGNENQNCQDVCSRQNLYCEPDYFKSINSFTPSKNCDFIDESMRLVLPANIIFKGFQIMCPQTDYLYFSCVSASVGALRLCPCRKFKKGNIAIY